MNQMQIVNGMLTGLVKTFKYGKKAIKTIKDTKQEMDMRKREKEYKTQIDDDNEKYESKGLNEVDGI